MPFKSQAQRGYMYAKHPKLAKEFEAKRRGFTLTTELRLIIREVCGGESI